MKITRNGEAFIPTNIERVDPILVRMTVGCERITIDEEALTALTRAKQRPQGSFYTVCRDRDTGKIVSVYGAGDTPYWKQEGVHICRVRADGSYVTGLNVTYHGINGMYNHQAWALEWHMTKPEIGS